MRAVIWVLLFMMQSTFAVVIVGLSKGVGDVQARRPRVNAIWHDIDDIAVLVVRHFVQDCGSDRIRGMEHVVVSRIRQHSADGWDVAAAPKRCAVGLADVILHVVAKDGELVIEAVIDAKNFFTQVDRLVRATYVLRSALRVGGWEDTRLQKGNGRWTELRGRDDVAGERRASTTLHETGRWLGDLHRLISRKESAEIASEFCRRWHCGVQSTTRDLPAPFLVIEEERLLTVFVVELTERDRAAYVEAKLILGEGAARRAI